MQRTNWEDGSSSQATSPSSWRGGLPFMHALAPVIRSTHLGSQIAALSRAAGVGSGNFTFSVPIVNYPGRGESGIDLSLVYNSRVWQKVAAYPKDRMVYDIDGDWPAPGWQFSLERMIRTGSKQMLLIGPDGSRHPSVQVGDHIQSGGLEVVTQRTIDGSLIDFSHEWSVNQPTDHNEGRALFPNGRLIEFRVASEDGRTLYPTAYIDRNGNATRIRYRNNLGPQIDNIEDPVGRVLRFFYDLSGRLQTINGPGCHGVEIELLRLHYGNLQFSTTWDAKLDVDAPDNPVVFDAIFTKPSGSGYWFGEAGDYSGYGMLRNVRSCSGMSWQADLSDPQGTVGRGTPCRLRAYDYPEGAGDALDAAPRYRRMEESWAGQEGPPETTVFSTRPTDRGSHGKNGTETKITNPDGSWTLQIDERAADTDGLLSSLSTYDASGRQLRSVASTWEAGDGGTPRVKVVVTKTPLGSTQVSFEYGPNNQVHVVTQTNGSGITTQRTVVDYLLDQDCEKRHILNLPAQVQVFDRSGAPVSCTAYVYGPTQLRPTPGITGLDERYNPESSTWVPAHDEKVWDDTKHPPRWTTVHVEAHWEGAYQSETAVRGLPTQLTRYTDPAGSKGAGGGAPVTTYLNYDLAGNLVQQALGPQQSSWTYSTVSNYGLPEQIVTGAPDPTHTARRLTSAATYNPAGRRATATDVNGCLTEVSYTRDGFRPDLIRLHSGAEVGVTYDDTARLSVTTIKEANGKVATTLRLTLDGLGRRMKSESSNDEGGWDVVAYQADSQGRNTRISSPYREGDPVSWGGTLTDPLGRVIETFAPDGSASQWFYDEAEQPEVRFEYKETTVRFVDPWGRQRWTAYDELGRIAAVVEPDPEGDGNVLQGTTHLTDYIYTATGLRITSSPTRGLFGWRADQDRELRYDGLGRLIASLVPERSATLTDPRAPGHRWSDTYTYDDWGNLTTHTDPRGIVARYEYRNDPLHRLSSIACDLTGFTDTDHPVSPAPDVIYVYEGQGDVRRISGEGAGDINTQEFVTAQNYTHDPFAGLTETQFGFEGLQENGLLTVNYDHDSLGRVTKVTHPARYGVPGEPRPVIVYAYGGGGRVTSMTVDGVVIASGIRYDAAGNIIELASGPPGDGQGLETYLWDRWHGWLKHQTLMDHAGTPQLDLTYQYEPRSPGGTPGKTGQAVTVIDNLAPEHSRSYDYDALGRLRQAAGGATTGNQWTQTYTYDKYGNRVDVEATGPNQEPDGQRDLTIDVSTNHINAVGWAYDAAGNVVERPHPHTGDPVKYGYDAAGRLATVTHSPGTVTVEYVYGVCHRRRASRHPATNDFVLHAWDGDNVIGHYTAEEPANPGGPAGADGKPAWRYGGYFLGSRLIAATSEAQPPPDILTLMHPDRLGTRFITRSDGDPTAAADLLWKPYGQVDHRPLQTPSYGTGFAGYAHEAETGLDYAQHRFYDPAAGRYLTGDPLGTAAFVLTNPQTLNAYNYVGGDPVNRADPSGLRWIEVWHDVTYQEGGYSVVDGVLVGPTTVGTGYYGAEWVSDAPNEGGTASGGGGNRGGGGGNREGGDRAVGHTKKTQTRRCDDDRGVQLAQALFSGQPRATTDIDRLAIGMLALPIAVAAAGYAAAAAIGVYTVPEYLYHFTSGAGGAAINATGYLRVGQGLYGAGVYLTSSTTQWYATLQGAASTDAVVRVATAGLEISRTPWPGTFLCQGPIPLP